MINKKSFVIPVAILVAIVLFCAIMCLVVHFSLSHDSAYAYDIAQPSVISGTFTQYIQDGLDPSLGQGWETYNFNSAVTSQYTYAYVYPIDPTGTCGITYPLPNIIQEGHQYLLRAHLLIPDSSNLRSYDIKLPHGPTISYAYDSFIDVDIFKIYTPDLAYGSAYLTFYSSSVGASFGVSYIEFIDLSQLTFGSNIPSDDAVIPVKSAFYHQYFGYNYHSYTTGVPASQITSYSTFSGGYDKGYEEGHTAGYNEGHTVGYEEGHTAGYNEGHTAGYNEGHTAGYEEGIASSYQLGFDDGFGEGVLVTRAQSYETVSSNFTHGSSSYAYNDRGILQPVNDGYNFLNIGWQDMFPTATWNSIKKVKSVSASCVMNLYTYQETYNPDTREYTYTDTTLYQSNILFKTSDVEYHTNGERIILILSYNIEGLTPDSDFIEIIISPHSTGINFVDGYIDSANVWPRTWYAVGARNAPSDYLFTFDINPIDSSTSYELGYDNGIKYADNRVYEGSASFTAGYNRGIDNAANATFPSVISAAIDVPVKTLTSLLNFELFGTNLNTFVLSLLSFGIVIGIVKLILGR